MKSSKSWIWDQDISKNMKWKSWNYNWKVFLFSIRGIPPPHPIPIPTLASAHPDANRDLHPIWNLMRIGFRACLKSELVFVFRLPKGDLRSQTFFCGWLPPSPSPPPPRWSQPWAFLEMIVDIHLPSLTIRIVKTPHDIGLLLGSMGKCSWHVFGKCWFENCCWTSIV